MNIAVIGLGKLGCPLAALLAAAGHEVLGVDTRPDVVKRINRHEAPVQEPGLQELMNDVTPRLKATTDSPRAAQWSDATFVVVPTPSDEEGTFSNRYVIEAAEAIGVGIRSRAAWSLVVITSTVMPGSTDGPIRAALERASGRVVGTSLGLCYSPEFIALGSVIRDMTNPDMILIGESDPRSGDRLAEISAGICENTPMIMRMSLPTAEVAKIAVNSFVTTKISYANMVSEICEALPGADAEDALRAIGMDSRIGQKYLRPATPYGGPCFPRDSVAVAALARSLGTSADISEATERINSRQMGRILDKVLAELPAGGRVGILGLAYKPNTAVIDGSTGVALAQLLLERAQQPIVYDPLAMPAARHLLGEEVLYGKSVADCYQRSDVVVITTPCEDFRFVPESEPGVPHPTTVVIDCWSLLDRATLVNNLDLVRFGAGPKP